MQAHGSFDITLEPQLSGITTRQAKADCKFGRQLFNKLFSGELAGESKGEMLSVKSPTPGSAGYVALELFSGTLNGKKGSFVLQHFATRQADVSVMKLEVVPDSGTGELAGLSGNMTITIENGLHYYDFDYRFTQPARTANSN